MLILISDAFDDALPGHLEALGEVTTDKDRIPEADVILIRSKTKVTREYIDNAPNLKLVVRGGVGLDNVDLEYAAEKGIKVSNTPTASSIAVAELAFALMLSVPNNIVVGHNTMTDGKWEKKQLKRTELHSKTLGLIGIGNIATEVAKRAAAFGMTVTAFDPFVDSSDHAEMKDSLDAMVAGADYISMHVPLNDGTKDMINADMIGKMKDGVIFVNTGRGGCVQAEDMKSALESGKVRCYATDVWPSDPPAEDYPLLSAPNVQMTPHLGASSKENLGRVAAETLSIVTDFIGGM